MRRQSSSSSSSSRSISAESEDRFEGRADQDRSLSRILSKLQLSRDVVAPAKFNGLGGMSLRRFFSDFEKYFSSKYRGSERQCAQLLGDFLEGTVKQAYTALKGPSAKYSKLKPQLLSWYKTERTSQRRIREEEFERAGLEPDESLSIYAIRLETLASEAFPGLHREQERALCRKFWDTIPSEFAKVLASSEHSLALMEGKSLNWKNLKKLAEVEDRQQRRRHRERGADFGRDREIYFSRPQLQEHVVTRGGAERSQSHKEVRFENYSQSGKPPLRPAFSPEKRFRSRVPSATRQFNCNWCGRRGHQESSCWIKLNACRICGSQEHTKEGCSRFDGEWAPFQPTCSICQGDHLGRDCTQNPLN